jgi:acetoacetyl-CoA synthetase
MWHWLVSALASEACVMLYEGSPFYPSHKVLWRLAAEQKMTVFGTSAKYLDSLAKKGYQPAKNHDLGALKVLLSTGSPLMPESFDYVYQHIKSDLQVSSISGGTDIISCFALGAPTLPVWRGELQCLGLGMAVKVYDEQGQPVIQQKGELVCVKPFPSRPIYFWDDPEQQAYRAAYFARFPAVWCHGDYVSLTTHHGLVIYGRSDAVLNPGGVRIGTAEIYRQVEQFDEVLESLVIGQTWQGDIRIVLFVHLREGYQLTEELKIQLREHIRRQATPHHVPAKIIAVSEIPRTKSGKIVELAVRKVVHGESVRNQVALANPEALAQYADLPELRE